MIACNNLEEFEIVLSRLVKMLCVRIALVVFTSKKIIFKDSDCGFD